MSIAAAASGGAGPVDQASMFEWRSLQLELQRSERQNMSSLLSLAPRRLGMLGDEAVPRADSVLAALAKHLEVKLAFGATGTQMKAKLKGWIS